MLGFREILLILVVFIVVPLFSILQRGWDQEVTLPGTHDANR